MKKSVGIHILADIHGCNPEILKHVDKISDFMFKAAKISGASIVGQFFKQFDPWGVSGVIIISESHLSIHTWPEHGLASIDYFSCSEDVDIIGAINYLKENLEAEFVDTINVSRGKMAIQKISQGSLNKEKVKLSFVEGVLNEVAI